MKRILNILLASITETENKWWHRLFTVLLFGSASFVFIFALSLALGSSNYHWITYHPVAFSLEPNYQQAIGTEFPCDWSFDTTRSDNEPAVSIIECKGVDIPITDARRYGKLYDVADEKLRQTDGIKQLDDKYVQICKDEVSSQTFPATYTGTLTPEFIAEIKCTDRMEKADPAYNQLYSQYQIDLNNSANIKAIQDVHIGTIIGDISLLLLIPIFSALIWIMFWSSIVYRSILYIIFGKQK